MSDDFYRNNSADEEKKLAATLSGDRYFPEHSSRALAVRYVAVNATLAYAGEAAPGSMGEEPVWRIKRIDTGSGGDVTVLYANGTAAFDKVWDDRTSYTY